MWQSYVLRVELAIRTAVHSNYRFNRFYRMYARKKQIGEIENMGGQFHEAEVVLVNSTVKSHFQTGSHFIVKKLPAPPSTCYYGINDRYCFPRWQ